MSAPDGAGRSRIPLPPIHEGELDRARLLALQRDLEALATVEEVRVRRRAGRHVDPNERPTLAEAFAALLGASAEAVQIRYRHDGAGWFDTLFVSAPGRFRIVRMRIEDPTR